VGFEGGQMPIQRRLPKVGFSSRIGRVTEELRLNELSGLSVDVIDIDALKAARLVNKNVQRVKVILSGKLEEAVTVKGLMLTKGARSAIEAAGGKIEE
jgi:large subunit ribosomal protein L15